MPPESLEVQSLKGARLMAPSRIRSSRTYPLAAFGHNRDGKKGHKQFNYGLVTTLDGCPVAVEVFPGNTADSLTVESQIRRLKEHYHFQRAVQRRTVKNEVDPRPPPLLGDQSGFPNRFNNCPIFGQFLTSNEGNFGQE